MIAIAIAIAIGRTAKDGRNVCDERAPETECRVDVN